MIFLYGSEQTWDQILKDISSWQTLISKLHNYQKDTVNSEILNSIEKYTSMPNFNCGYYLKASKAASGFCQWALAMKGYARVTQMLKADTD